MLAEKDKKIIIDIMILGIILCSFVGGFWLGEKLQTEKDKEFYIDYIETDCSCKHPIIVRDNKIIYEKDTIMGNLSYY